MIDKKSYKKAIGKPLEMENFIKKGQSWYLNGRDAIVSLNLQKSDWSNLYYINITIYLKSLDKMEFLSKNVTHLSFRVERLFPEKMDLIRESSDLEKSNFQLLDQISEFIKSELIPFLKQCTLESALKKFVADGRFNSGFINKEARLYLDKG